MVDFGKDSAAGLRANSLGQAMHSRIDLDRQPVYDRCGAFEVRLAANDDDIRRTQRLRYKVFYEEGGAIAGQAARSTRRDLCSFDTICDHLIVVDLGAKTSGGALKPKVVGTYRLLRGDVAERHGGFYSQSEFDLAPLLARHANTRFLELGRSCVHRDYRSRRIIELLWRGLWLYTRRFAIDALIGCASLNGIDPEDNRLPISFLYHHARADEAWQVEPLPLVASAFTPSTLLDTDARRGLQSLPPLVKAYLRTGARFSSGVVVDRQFGTTDLFTVLEMAKVEQRYLSYYGEASCLSEAQVA